MQDITQIFDHFRITARGLWNTGFWSQSNLQNWDAYERFEQIKSALFDALVRARLGMTGESSGDELTSTFQVIPGDP